MGILLLIVMGFILFGIYKKRKQKKGDTIKAVPPHIRAEKAIRVLEAKQLFEKNDVKGFYFKFSEIIRRYMESLRHFPAAEYTTEEISSSISHEQDRKIIPLLRQADLVKFADKLPLIAKKEEEVKAALLYIRNTCEVFEEDTGKNKGKGADK